MHTTYDALGSDTVVVHIEGELDAFTAPDLKEQLSVCLESGFRRVVVEMSGCPFIDSTGLGVLVDFVKHARGRELALAAPGSEIRRVLEVVGLDRVLPICGSVSEALRTH